MSDVAKVAGVSAMTVSRALRSPGTVTPETLRRIEAAINSVGYVPNRVAGTLSSRHSNIVGLIVPSLRNSLFSETIQGVADTLRPKLDLMIANSGYSLKGEEDAVMAFLSQRVCGIILHNVRHTARTRRLLEEAQIPCVETGDLTRSPIDMSVGFSNFEAAREMTSYLLTRGARRVGFASLPLRDNDRAARRRDGYLKALEDFGVAPVEEIVIEVTPGLDGGARALRRLLDTATGIDAAFLTGDVLALGALLEAQRIGISVPKDLRLAGSDDNDLHERLSPSLTSLRFPRYEIGRRAAGLIADRILTGQMDGPVIMDLGYRLMERQSA